MDRTIVLPYEPTTSPILSKIPGTAAGDSRSGGQPRLLYIHICTQADYYWLGEIDLICTTTIMNTYVLAHVTFKPASIATHIDAPK